MRLGDRAVPHQYIGVLGDLIHVPWMQQTVRVVVLLLILVLSFYITAAQASPKLYDFKIVQQDNVMLHLDLDAAEARSKMFTLDEPHRLVIDLVEATLGTQLPTQTFAQGVVKAVRYAQHGEDYLRVVLDLRREVAPTSRIVQRQGGQRLIIDMGVPADVAFNDRGRLQGRSQAPVQGQSQGQMHANPEDEAQAGQPGQLLVSQQSQAPEPEPRDVIIAIDAGHGGKDPGAIGRGNTFEKDVVLAVAIRLHDQLKDVKGVKPVLIRSSDVYIALRERMELARQADADMFVSIHADAATHERAQGGSVYALSMDGASSEAALWMAKSDDEAAALHGDVSLHGLDDSLAQTLLSLTQGDTMERSIDVGTSVLNELEKIGRVHKATVEPAAFAVLKSPDIPSILVETAFISNRDDEKKLNSADYQEQLAVAIGQGLYNYLWQRAPEGTYLASLRR